MNINKDNSKQVLCTSELYIKIQWEKKEDIIKMKRGSRNEYHI